MKIVQFKCLDVSTSAIGCGNSKLSHSVSTPKYLPVPRESFFSFTFLGTSLVFFPDLCGKKEGDFSNNKYDWGLLTCPASKPCYCYCHHKQNQKNHLNSRIFESKLFWRNCWGKNDVLSLNVPKSLLLHKLWRMTWQVELSSFDRKAVVGK